MPREVDDARPLGLRHVYAISTGAMFSSGFFLLPGLAADETGPSLAVAYLLAGLLVVPAMLSTAELSTAFPRAGGPYHFLQRSLGPAIALIGALGLFVAMILKAGFALVGVGAYLSIVADVPVEPVAIALAVVFTALNLAGARESAQLQLALVTVLLVVLGAFLGAGAVEVGRRRDEVGEAFSPFFAGGAPGLFAATGMLFVAFAGLLQVASVAGEVRRPERTIPRGMLLALATTTAIYGLGAAVMVIVMERQVLHDHAAPVAAAAGEVPLPVGTGLVVAAALAAFGSTGNAGIMSASRYPLALARDRLLWSKFARLGTLGTPTLAVLLTGALTIAAIVALDIESIARLASAVVLVVFALLNLAVIVLRRGRVPGYRPAFRAPWHPWTQVGGILAAIVLVIDLGLAAALLTGAVVVVGAVWHLAAGRKHDDVDSGAAAHLLHRVIGDPPTAEDLERLQEEGPHAEDRASELLHHAAVVRLERGSGPRDIADAAAEKVAEVLEVDAAEAGRWLRSPRHLTVEPDPGRAEVHLLLLDTATEPQIVLATAGPGHDEDGAGRVTAVVTGPEDQRDRLTRVVALLTAQLADRDLAEHLGQAAGDDEPPKLRQVLVDDATHRQGGTPPRSGRATGGSSPR